MSMKQKLFGKNSSKSYAMILILAVIWVVFTFFTSNYFQDFSVSFISPRNLSNLTRQMAVVGIVSIGAMLVVISGGIDLSSGALLGLCSLISAMLMRSLGASTPVAILGGLSVGTVCGLIQGVVVAYTGIPPFIVTLGSSMVFEGAMLILGKGTTISSLNASFVQIGQAYLPKGVSYILAAIILAGYGILTWRKIRARKRHHLPVDSPQKTAVTFVFVAVLVFAVVLLMNSYQGIAVPVVIMLVMTLIFHYVASSTTLGRRIYAVGGNTLAARYAGINVPATIISVYTIAGLLSALGGIVLSARLGAASPSAGSNMNIDGIAAAVIGGASMLGGIGFIPGALLGALMMASIENGMSLMNMDSAWQYVVKGIVLVIAVGFDVLSKKKQQ